ncbi:hypothetical protein KPL78_18460 [Roseomonas sp. HJA6]|uniref:Uncharacterized protein n=1 Tax=Roseomonas alba TaxID=2846776 RepID=A0ABS7ACF1_9PROT|nr:hypothetical protein [Neoroseomonas alba]MBW6399848.1 hypothetical protein [Neoroseomonas alba]
MTSDSHDPRQGGAMVGRRVMALALAALPAACAGVSPIEAARLARDGEHATGRLAADVSAAQQRVERARDLVLLRAALAAPAGTGVAALRAQPGVMAADARLAPASAILAQDHEALEGLRESYRGFGEVAAGRDPEAFDALLDRAMEDAEALRTLIERHATDGSELVESLPGGETVIGVARLAGGAISRARAARGLMEPNDALIALLDSLIGSAEREKAMLGPLLAEVAADHGADVAAALRRAGVARVGSAAALDGLAESFGWSISPLADQRLREGAARRVALGLDAVAARRATAEPARMLDPAAGRAVLAALRDRHLALRAGARRDPDALRDSLHRLAR